MPDDRSMELVNRSRISEQIERIKETVCPHEDSCGQIGMIQKLIHGIERREEVENENETFWMGDRIGGDRPHCRRIGFQRCVCGAISASLQGMDALLAIVQMPPAIPVATVGIDAGQNAGLLAVQILAVGNSELRVKLQKYKSDLKTKIVKANEQLREVKYKFKIN